MYNVLMYHLYIYVYLGFEPPQLDSTVGRVEEGVRLLDFHASVSVGVAEVAQLRSSLEDGSKIRNHGLDLHVSLHGWELGLTCDLNGMEYGNSKSLGLWPLVCGLGFLACLGSGRACFWFGLVATD